MTNFAHLDRDPETNLDFITEVGTGQRLYKHPNCALCGIPRYSRHAVLPDCGEACDTHPKHRVAEMFG